MGHLFKAIITSAGILSAVALGPDAQANSFQFFKIGAGATSGTYFPVAGLIAQVISSPPGAKSCNEGGNCGVPGLTAVAQQTGGSVANVDALEIRTYPAAFAQADVAYWAHTATGPFHRRSPKTSLCTITSLYDEQVHVLVPAALDAGSLADAKGQRIILGKRDSGALLGAMAVVNGYGLKAGTDFNPVLTDFAGAMQQFDVGQADAMITVSGYPNEAITQLHDDHTVQLIPIAGPARDRIIASNKFFVPSMIPGGSYPGQADNIETIAVPALLLSRTDVDQELLYKITNALWRNPRSQAILSGGHPRGADITLDSALRGVSVPLCEGSARFYQEAGML